MVMQMHCDSWGNLKLLEWTIWTIIMTISTSLVMVSSVHHQVR
jgi:hypothetical protein